MSQQTTSADTNSTSAITPKPGRRLRRRSPRTSVRLAPCRCSGRSNPRKRLDSTKIRLGRNFDGGYVLLDDFADVGAALSLGINDDASWDLDIAQRNIPVQQFDHTIDRGARRSPADHLSQGRRCSRRCARRVVARQHRASPPRWMRPPSHPQDGYRGARMGGVQGGVAFLARPLSPIVSEFHLLQHVAEPEYAELFRLVLDGCGITSRSCTCTATTPGRWSTLPMSRCQRCSKSHSRTASTISSRRR